MSLLKNSSIVIVGIFVSNLMAYVFHFLAGRMLGPGDYGVFGALTALFLQAAIPATALNSGITKFTSIYQNDDKPGNIALLRKKIQSDLIFFSAFILGLIIIFSQSIAKFLHVDSNTLVILISISITFYLLLAVNRGILQGLRKFQVVSWNLIVEALSRLLLLAIFFYLGYGVKGAILAYGLAYFAALLFVFPYIKETRKEIINKEEIKIRPIYKFILLVLFANLIIQSIINVPSILIKHYYSDEFTGYWTAALNIARISLFITSSISLVMFPEIASEINNQKKKKIFGRAIFMVILFTSGIAILFFLIPQFLLKSLYGSAYLGAAPILQWMGFVMILVGLLQLTTDFFLARLKSN